MTDDREHLVNESRYARAVVSGTGEAVAVCGGVVLIAALATPPGRPCETCAVATR